MNKQKYVVIALTPRQADYVQHAIDCVTGLYGEPKLPDLTPYKHKTLRRASDRILAYRFNQAEPPTPLQTPATTKDSTQ